MKSNEQHVDALKSKTEIQKKIDSNVFESFKHLTDEKKLGRINSSISLLNYLNRTQNSDEEKNRTERAYSLKRLIRGLGASTSVSRTGFYTTLVAFLTLPSNDAFPSVSDIFALMDKQLSVSHGGSINKEDSDGLVGQILVCAALIHSNKLTLATAEEIKKCIQTLINASHQKTFHSSLAYTFLLELLEKFNSTQFGNLLWPLMRKELKRPWERQNINTVQFLIETQIKYPAIVDDDFLNSSLKTNEILTPIAFKYLGRLFWAPATATVATAHPSYETLGKFLATSVPSDLLLRFWQSEINEILLAPTKLKEIATLRILTIIFTHKNFTQDTAIHLLSDAFIKMLITSLKNYKQQKVEFIEPFYTEFFNSIENYLESLGSTADSDTAKVAIIKRLIGHPGTLIIEKYTPNRIIHRFIEKLSATGVIELFEFYKNILLEKVLKNPKDKTEGWLHVEKQHCVQMLQTLLNLRIVHGEQEWRTTQLKLLFRLGLLYVDKNIDKFVAKENDSGIISKELANQLRHTFYASLQAKSQRLDDEKKTLLALVQFANQALVSKTAIRSLRFPLSEKTLQSWKKMFAIANKINTSKRNTKLNSVFNILLLNMGLQLFIEPNMAQEAIDDLEKCMEKTQKKLDSKTKLKETNEPEWIEVVVDLFLHLLSQNTTFLRNIVDNVFPQLCENLNLTAVHQILSMLDMKEKNPLSETGKIDQENGENNEESDDSENESDRDSDNGEQTDDNDDDENDDETEEEEEEEEEEDVEDEDEGTVTDQLRSVICSALGAAATETDTESVDLNDMDEAEAERLDAALGDAFKLLRKGNGGESKKKTKKERTTNTTVMHFRIRVLDLIEIYLKTNPSLMVTLEILLALFGMTEHCNANKDLLPLSNRLNRVIKSLLSLRHFANVDDVTEENIAQLLNSLVEEKVNAKSINEHNKLVSQCFTFLTSASQFVKSDTNNSPVLTLIQQYLENFLNHRNPKVALSCFENIMRSRWVGAWHLGQTLVENGLLAKNNARGFRRSQAIELLSLLYKNHGFITQDIATFNKINSSIENGIQEYIKWLKESNCTSPKEFSVLINLLKDLYKLPNRIDHYKSKLNWNIIGACIQQIRQNTILLSYPMYASLCQLLKIVPIKNNDTSIQQQKEHETNGVNQNGHVTTDSPNTNGGLKRKAESTISNGTKKQKQNLKKLKKLKKEERLKIASAGFNHNIAFNLNDTNGETEDNIAENESEVNSDSD